MSEFIGWIDSEHNIILDHNQEIVRCRDCKYHHEGMCILSDGMGDFKRWYVDDDDYCSDGERKECGDD